MQEFVAFMGNTRLIFGQRFTVLAEDIADAEKKALELAQKTWPHGEWTVYECESFEYLYCEAWPDPGLDDEYEDLGEATTIETSEEIPF